MAKVGHKIRAIIVGTKKSFALDEDEEFVLEFDKDEDLREDFTDVSDLIDHVIENSFKRGDMIRSLMIDGEDFVRKIITKTLLAHGLNVEDALPEISSMPFICSADYSDIYEIVSEIAQSLQNNTDDGECDEY